MTEPTRSVVTLGETMALIRASEIGSLRHIGSLALGIGGAESNVAVALRRLGVPVAWFGRVGDDPFGERVVRELRGEGIDVGVVVDPDAPTGLMVKERPAAAATAVHYYRTGSAGSRLTPGDIPPDRIEAATLLHVTGITPLLSESAAGSVRDAVSRARAAGVAVSFDVNYRARLAGPGVAAPVLRELAEASDIVFGGEAELELITGEDPDTAARSLRAAGVAEVVIKRGPHGATAHADGGVVDSPGFVIDPLDTVGAGDAFVAGYLSARLAGHGVAQALRRGNACGAMACLGPGDWEASPTLADLERFQAAGVDPVQR
ncbi:sugar kinase [Microbacterium sp. Yaish 1]|uniref:sugar kinase n=1 Tax=Microbacterium sp. Yaish 1 TaxID=2025014 RepID=UPI000B943DD4|nr:sugar kinase [Microbacterium sp. Yaish 1]OYC96067.1 ribokinase [Microbacterium sp. Yaish 1]